MKILSTYFVFFSFAFGFLSCEKEISISPPTTPVPIAYIYIDSNPRGAMIYADGRISGKTTPDSLNWLEEKTYYFTLKKDLYRDTSFSVVIKKDERKKIFIDYLQNPKMFGKIYFNTIPDSANIFLENDSTGFTTPYTLSGVIPGNYHIVFKKKNCITDSIDITVRSNKKTDAFSPLTDTTYWVEYSTSNSRFPIDQLTAIAIDKKGILWFGSNGGLISFNGDKWREYNTLNSGLASNFIKVIKVDADNNKWIGTNYGLSKFNGNVWITYTKRRNQLPDNYINDIIPQDDGIYVCTNNGLVRKTHNNWELLYYYECNGFAIDVKDTMWLITKFNGIANYQSSIGVYSGLWIFHYSDNNNTYNCIAPDVDDLWCGHISNSNDYYGLTSIPMERNYIRRKNYPIFDNHIVNEIKLRNDEKWICTDQGLYIFTTYPEVKRYWGGNTPLKSNDIVGVVFDNNGNAWIATANSGLYKFKIPWR